jgi:hypothetical protein
MWNLSLKKFFISSKSKIAPITVVVLSFWFLGWGSVGHNKINYNTGLTALPTMSFFTDWPDFLAAHGSDADNRKSSDPDEGPKHYIDIDNYPDFIQSGSITQDFDSIVAKYGYSFVIDLGILPWAILNTADSLQVAFENNDMDKAKLISADLGHYVGDAHMPLHITKNYNGQYTNQSGVHSRYESGLIQRFEDKIIYSGDSLKYIDNLPEYVFNMIYGNYQYVDSVLIADKAASTYAGSTSTDVYYTKFWELSKNFTIDLFKKASNKIACIIYTEWVNAGGQVSSITQDKYNIINDFNLFQNYPNPFNPSTKISWQLVKGNQVTLKIFSSTGEEVKTLINEYEESGKHSIIFAANSSLTSGIYFYQLRVGDFVQTKKMILMK